MAKLRLIQGGRGLAPPPPPEPEKISKFVDPLSKEQRHQAADFALTVVGLVEKPARGNVASSLVASVEWALAADVPWAEFVQLARNEFIKAKARRKPGPFRK